MSGARRGFASRANGSLGGNRSRSAAGKARHAEAVRRHGLSLPVARDEALAPEVEGLARALVAAVAPKGAATQGGGQTGGQAGDRAGGRIDVATAVDTLRQALANNLADAAVDLYRVRLAKRPHAAALDADPENAAALAALARLEHYEARAVSRRRLALRAFAAAMAGAEQSVRPRLPRIRLRVANFGGVT